MYCPDCKNKTKVVGFVSKFGRDATLYWCHKCRIKWAIRMEYIEPIEKEVEPSGSKESDYQDTA